HRSGSPARPVQGLRVCPGTLWQQAACHGALNLPGDLGEDPGCAVRCESLDAQLVHDLPVVVDVLAAVQVQRAGELLDVHDVRQFRFSEAQDGERAACGGVTAAAERDHLNRDLRQAGD